MEPISVALFSRRPPPVGGVSVWTERFLAAAPAHGIAVTLVPLGPPPRGPMLGWRRPPLRRGLVGPLRRMCALPAATVVHVCASAGASLWRALALAGAALARGRRAVVHLHSRVGRCSRTAQRTAAAMARHPRVRFVTPHRGDARAHAWLAHVGHFVPVGDAPPRACDTSASRAAREDAARGYAARGYAARGYAARGGAAQGDAAGPGTAAGRRPLRLLYAGWLIREKGLWTLWAALARAPDCVLRAVGPDVRPRDGRRLRRWAARPALAGRIALGGPLGRRELAAAMAACDAVICPSPDESFGLVAAEAMVRGVPLIAAPAGFLADAPPDTFVRLTDTDPACWATTLATLATCPAPLAEAGRRGSAWARSHLTAGPVLAAWTALYRDLPPPRLAGPRGGRAAAAAGQPVPPRAAVPARRRAVGGA